MAFRANRDMGTLRGTGTGQGNCEPSSLFKPPHAPRSKCQVAAAVPSVHGQLSHNAHGFLLAN